MTFESVPDYRTAREKYNPLNIGIAIEVLWIAESPPVGGGYFYYETSSRNPSLFIETMRALFWWPEKKPMPTGMDKTPLLKKFQSHGHFLMDLSEEPVNQIKNRRERKLSLMSHQDRLMLEVRKLAPKHVILVKESVFDVLRSSLREQGFTVLNQEPVPFPNNHWQPRFREGIRRALLEMSRTGFT